MKPNGRWLIVCALLTASVLTACEIKATPAPPAPTATATVLVSSETTPDVTVTSQPIPSATAPEPTVTPAPTETPEAQLPPIEPGNLDRLEALHSFEFEAPERLDWSEDGRTLAVVSRARAGFYDVESGQELATMTFAEPEIVLDACADNGMVATTRDLYEVLLYSAESGAVEQALQTSGVLYQASFAPDGSLIAVPQAEVMEVALFDPSTGEKERDLSGFETAAPVYGARFAANGKVMIWVSRGRVQPQELSSGAFGPDLGHQEFVSAFALSHDGRILAVTTAATVNDEFTPVIQLWDADSGADRGVLLPGDEIPSALDFSALNRLLASSLAESVVFWDVDGLQQLAALPPHADRVTALAFSPDGRMLATAGMDGVVHVWRVAP